MTPGTFQPGVCSIEFKPRIVMVELYRVPVIGDVAFSAISPVIFGKLVVMHIGMAG